MASCKLHRVLQQCSKQLPFSCTGDYGTALPSADICRKCCITIILVTIPSAAGGRVVTVAKESETAV